MEEAEGLCDRLGIFVDGALRCIGNPKALIPALIPVVNIATLPYYIGYTYFNLNCFVVCMECPASQQGK
jgi:hypothetical protein